MKINTSLFFGYLVNCFDRLWLRDCLLDLHEAGAREREIRLLYFLNKEASFQVITPAGTSKEIKVGEIVKQGTVFGTKLCCSSTGKINEEITRKHIIYPTVSTKAVTYVDDISAAGSGEFVEETGNACGQLEKKKYWEFSLEKTKWMCMQHSRTEQKRELQINIKQGKVEEATECKQLGGWVNNKGNIDTHLQHMRNKSKGVIQNIRLMCAEVKIGKQEMTAKLFVYEHVAIRSIYDNIEVWTNLRQKDMEMLETIQGEMLKGILGLGKSTPYWGLLYELKILPIKLLITYRKLMLYHKIINEEGSIKQKIVAAQEEGNLTNCWFGDTARDGMEIGLSVSSEMVKNLPKSKWKKKVKELIWKTFEHDVESKKNNMRKLRFLKQTASTTYLQDTSNETTRKGFQIRLNMVDWIGDNFGRNRTCILCEEQKDTTEHVFQCNKLKQTSANPVVLADLKNGRRMKEIVELFNVMERKRRELLIDNIITKANVIFREQPTTI